MLGTSARLSSLYCRLGQGGNGTIRCADCVLIQTVPASSDGSLRHASDQQLIFDQRDNSLRHVSSVSRVAAQELLQEIQRRLTSEERQLVELRNQGLAWAVIAEQLGESPVVLRKRLSTGVSAVDIVDRFHRHEFRPLRFICRVRPAGFAQDRSRGLSWRLPNRQSLKSGRTTICFAPKSECVKILRERSNQMVRPSLFQ
jgi:hypothetical protein